MNIARRQFFRGLAALAASPVAIAVAKALPVLEPVRVRYLSSAEITREVIQLLSNCNEFFQNMGIPPPRIGTPIGIRLPSDYHLS